jgi:competence protein ComGC
MGIINKLKINSIRQKKCFTLIEMIVVIATIGLVLPAIFAIIFSILQQQLKIQRLSIVKKEGDYVLNVMENTIRNYAVKIYSESSLKTEMCTAENPTYRPSNSSDFFFRDKSDRWFNFYQNYNNISSNSANLSSPVNLNSSQTRITNFSIQCYKTALYSTAVINISFTIEYNTTSSRTEEKVPPLTYQTKVKLRNY